MGLDHTFHDADNWCSGLPVAPKSMVEVMPSKVLGVTIICNQEAKFS